jgi:sugar porter (SP) family MFS transporter
MEFFKKTFGHHTTFDVTGYNIHTWEKSLITSILSLGTFVGALSAGTLADVLGRRRSILLSCWVFSAGVAMQTAATTIDLLVVGRVVTGLGVGVVSSVVIVHVSEIAPRRVRGTLVSLYQFAITMGLFISSLVDQATHSRQDLSCYRIPIPLILVWAGTLALGLFLLPESPRWLIMKGRVAEAALALSIVRGRPIGAQGIQAELWEIQLNYNFQLDIASDSWLDPFRGGTKLSGNLRRTLLGTFLQMFQQWTGVNFICKSIKLFAFHISLTIPPVYYGTTFFQQSGIKNAFVISVITNVVNVVSTPISFYTIEKFGRRTLLIYGALAMMVCEFVVAIVGTVKEGSAAASTCLVVFVCIYIFAFASTWGPSAWVLIGELFPLPIRAKGVALCTASNWLWNFAIAYSTPYIVDTDEGNLRSKVFFVWGSTCFLCLLFAYVFVPETKGLSLEQIDLMLEETTPTTSAAWKPHQTFRVLDEERIRARTRVPRQFT